MSVDAAPRAPWHWALLYADEQQYVDGVLGFVDSACAAERPVFVSVPAEHGRMLRENMNGAGRDVRFADMAEVGRNPSCIIPAIRAFLDEHADEHVSFVGEPIWPGRTRSEVAEATRHEALINTAFEDSGAHILCPYDLTGLDPSVVIDAYRTHPDVIDQTGRHEASERYTDPREVWADVAHLPLPPADAHRMAVTADHLGALREYAHAVASTVPLAADRRADLVIAITELATNSIRHGGGSATVAMWSEPGRMVCDVQDAGAVHDPLVGRRRPALDATGGRGLWLVNHLCDLVQLHSSASGTTVRITVGP